MSYEQQDRELEDARLEQALRRFRSSVHAWSEAEFSRPRTVRRSRWSPVWHAIANPVTSWALAVMLLGSSIGIPVAVHHEHQLAIQKQQRIEHQKELAAQEAKLRAAQALDDAAFLSDVDSDIAQATPEAMQPLASLMSDSAGTAVQK